MERLTLEQNTEQCWVSVSERMPVKEYELHRKLYGVDPEFVVVIKGAKISTVLQLHRDKDGKYYWHDGEDIYPVIYWMPMPPAPMKIRRFDHG